MKSKIKILSLLSSIAQLSSIVKAQPYVGFPFDEQLPDIARVGEEYSFPFNSQTFKSDIGDSITYSASNLPDWLSLDTNSLILSGTPSEDYGSVTFILTGTDSQSSLNQSCTLMTSKEAAPVINSANTISEQLENIGETNGYSGLVLKESESFSIKFDKDTFQMPSGSKNSIVDYYGKSANRTSLPSWCFFDSDSLTFSGTAPTINSLDAPSQQFDLILIATDYAGYTGAYSKFEIVVGGHYLYLNGTDTANRIVNTTSGDSFDISVPLQDIYLDGSQISQDDISKVVAYNSPSWVVVSGNTEISGTVPTDQTENVVLNVTLFDIYGDSVYLSFELDILHSVFTVDSLPDVNATRGEFFEYTLPNSDFTDLNNTDINCVYDGADWLTFYHTNNTFAGQVPKDFKELGVEVEASMNSLSQTESFNIKGISSITSSSHFSSFASRTRSSRSSSYSSRSRSRSSSHSSLSYSSKASSSARLITSSRSSISSTSSALSSTSSYSSSSAVPLITSNKTSDTNSKSLAIGLGVAIPLFFIILSGLLFFFCCFKRRKNKDEEKSDDNTGKNGGPSSVPMVFGNTNKSAETLTTSNSAHALAEKNLYKLDDSASSNYSITASTLRSDSSNENKNLYQVAIGQHSSEQLLNSNTNSVDSGAGDSGIFNSWRRNSSTGKFKPRDSLSSLATVATNDLLTVNFVNDPDIKRKSQLNFLKNSGTMAPTATTIASPNSSKLRNVFVNSDGEFGSVGDESDKTNYTVLNPSIRNSTKSNLAPLKEEESELPRDESFQSTTSSTNDPKLVEFQNKGSISRRYIRDDQSYCGVIED